MNFFCRSTSSILVSISTLSLVYTSTIVFFAPLFLGTPLVSIKKSSLYSRVYIFPTIFYADLSTLNPVNQGFQEQAAFIYGLTYMIVLVQTERGSLAEPNLSKLKSYLTSINTPNEPNLLVQVELEIRVPKIIEIRIISSLRMELTSLPNQKARVPLVVHYNLLLFIYISHYSKYYFKFIRQLGHLCSLANQGIRQFSWNIWLHGSFRIISPSQLLLFIF